MDPNGFLKALEDFPVASAGDAVEALVDLWNGEMARAVDTIAPKHPLPQSRAKRSPWFTVVVVVMKGMGWRRSGNGGKLKFNPTEIG